MWKEVKTWNDKNKNTIKRANCLWMNLDSSPKASTPKCSQTAGQNCSLHETKSSSKLKDKTRPISWEMHLNLLLLNKLDFLFYNFLFYKYTIFLSKEDMQTLFSRLHLYLVFY